MVYSLSPSPVPLLGQAPPPLAYSGGFAPVILRDQEHGGLYQIVGTVADAGQPDKPVSRLVRLYRLDGMLTRETWSAQDGTFAFLRIANQTYYIITRDHTGRFNAVVADSVIPEPMP